MAFHKLFTEQVKYYCNNYYNNNYDNNDNNNNYYYYQFVCFQSTSKLMATGRSCNKEPSTTETSKVPIIGFTGSNNKNNLYYFFLHPFFVGLQIRLI